MTVDPAQVQPTEEQNPAPAGEEAAGSAAPSGQTSNEQPFFVATTQEEYEAKFGPTRNEGRLSLAKKYGYDSVEAFDAYMTEVQSQKQAQETEAQKAAREAREARAAERNATKEVRQLKLEREAERQALALGANPQKLDAVIKLRDASANEITAEGVVDPKLVKASIKSVLDAHPYFKGSGATSVGGGGAPAAAASTANTLDQQIADAQKSGNVMDQIGLQMKKLFS